MSLDTNELLEFVVSSHKSGFSTGDTSNHIKESDGSITIVFEQDKWKMHDNYFGGEPYGGREVVFYDKKPIWIMVYYGYVNEMVQQKEIESVYSFLRKALSLV